MKMGFLCQEGEYYFRKIVSFVKWQPNYEDVSVDVNIIYEINELNFL